jgi:tellurite resistance protein
MRPGRAVSAGSRAVRVSETPAADPYALAPVQDALDRIEAGGFAEAVTRMLVLAARARGAVRRSRLQRATEILDATEPFSGMNPKQRTHLIHRESIIVSFASDLALRALPKLLTARAERERALALCYEIAGPVEEMEPPVVALFARFAELFGADNPAATAPARAGGEPREATAVAAGRA